MKRALHSLSGRDACNHTEESRSGVINRWVYKVSSTHNPPMFRLCSAPEPPFGVLGEEVQHLHLNTSEVVRTLIEHKAVYKEIPAQPTAIHGLTTCSLL